MFVCQSVSIVYCRSACTFASAVLPERTNCSEEKKTRNKAKAKNLKRHATGFIVTLTLSCWFSAGVIRVMK